MYRTRDEKVKETVESLKIALPIDVVLDKLDVKQSGGAYFCPLVPHHKASFRVTKTGTGFQCFHCGAKGTVITLLTELSERGLLHLSTSGTFESLLLAIGDEFDVPLPYKNFNTSVDDDIPLTKQIDYILNKTKHRAAQPTTETVEMLYKNNIMKLKTGEMPVSDFVDFVASVQEPKQSAAIDLIASFKSLEDLFEDDEDDDGSWEGLTL